MTQKDIWRKHAESENASPALLERPARFQVEFASLLDLLIPENAHTVEAGAEFGITSFLLRRPKQRSIIDYNEGAIAKARELWVGRTPDTFAICGDLFEANHSLQGKFDLVFNAGVIEHYSFDERVKLIQAMRGLAREGSLVVIAFPNHYSIAYRVVYLLRSGLHIWRFPAEHKLFDLSRECEAVRCTQILRVVIADSSVFSWSDVWYFRWLKPLLRLLNYISKVEGYLTVCVIR